MPPAHPAPPELLLASASPRRRALLERAGLAFGVQPADLDETPLAGEAPVDCLVRLAREKARAVAAGLDPAAPRLVLGADTGVLLGEALFGKPRDAAHAVELLSRLLGQTHRVVTAVAVVESRSGRVHEVHIESRVRMREASREEVEAYVAGGEPLDKAGAYAVQGEGRKFVDAVIGSESNVIGLPLEETLALLERARRERDRS